MHAERFLDGSTDPRKFAIDWIVGSGQFGHSFLTKDGDFLIQSPLTWYTTRDCWDMSPGYDHADHHGFRRAVSARCLYCHAGQTRQRDGNEYFTEVVEASIGCERCHGPGSLHVDKWTTASDVQRVADAVTSGDDALDPTIVNPSLLSRELQESVCEQCHLQGDTQVLVRGRRFDDFRPGLPLHLFRQEFRASAETGMTVVGHVEQMRASQCYTKTESLTCTTCHHPHRQADAEQQTQLFRQACLNCHQSEACRETTDLREAKSDRCADCHMPKAPTEVPHVAFTHHRIGIHKQESNAAMSATGATQIVPLTLEAGLWEGDVHRNHGLAWLHTVLSGSASNPGDALKQARDELQTA